MKQMHLKSFKFKVLIFNWTSGFTLIELLVVIAIIATILAAAVPNFLGARERAKDAKKKAELNQVKAALRLYYNDYQKYPEQETVGPLKTKIYGCGATGTEGCPKSGCTVADFLAGGDGCSTATIYMKKLPTYTVGTMYYFKASSGDDFRLYADLENASDPDVSASQARCPVVVGASYNAKTYVVCAD